MADTLQTWRYGAPLIVEGFTDKGDLSVWWMGAPWMVQATGGEPPTPTGNPIWYYNMLRRAN